MLIDKEKADEAFMRYSLSSGVEYVLNDSVEITGGDSKGLKGAVISIDSVNPEVIFMIELGDGRFVNVPQRLLKIIT
jgi:hypothetical protein